MASVFDDAKLRSDASGPELMRKGSFSLLTGQMQRPSGPSGDEHPGNKYEKLHKMMQNYLPNTKDGIQSSVVNHIEYDLGCTRFNFSDQSCYQAAALAVRDRLIESLNDTNAWFEQEDPKRCYYLSAEYLIGRYMQNALCNLDIEDNFKEALMELGFNLEELYEQEADPALGNGGLGRLAACFLDSCATQDLPLWGYGIRYEHGMFEQRFKDGNQVEYPDTWLTKGNPWEIQRLDIKYPVQFYGSETVMAVAYDVPIPDRKSVV